MSLQPITGRPSDRLERCANLIIGSGIAGLTLALKLAESSDVVMIAKGGLTDSNTWWAQGGIAGVLDSADSFDKHVEDTLQAGAGLCREDVVWRVIRSGPRSIQELIEWGVPFTGEGGQFHLTREGGHSHRRVIHAADVTGQAVVRTLIERTRRHPRIRVVEHQMAIDLVTTDKYAPDFSANHCLGAYVLDRATGEIYRIRSDNTFLCTGGHGKVYLYTSNPDSATGDGLAMGWRAGCKVANLEFMQFHPTCLYHPQAKTFLISEAVRGEGATLKDRHGEEFMGDYHSMGSLAPRDIVARAIDLELKKTGDAFALLDATGLGPEKIEHHFPTILATCLKFGIDMRAQPIPVVPAAHYSCGGLVVDERGSTGIEGLYALGETACSGLHGANRLASNSLLEALVYADLVAADAIARQSAVKGDRKPLNNLSFPAWDERGSVPADELVVLSHTWDEIRRLMWNYVGIVRTDRRLQRAASRLAGLRQELDSFYWEFQVSEQLLEVRNLALVAQLTVQCAMARKESRGIHYNLDYPHLDDKLPPRDTILR